MTTWRKVGAELDQLKDVPFKHGVYVIFHVARGVQYVGSTNNLHTRLERHEKLKGVDRKFYYFKYQARTKRYLSMEYQLIRRLKPLWNVRGKTKPYSARYHWSRGYF